MNSAAMTPRRAAGVDASRLDRGKNVWTSRNLAGYRGLYRCQNSRSPLYPARLDVRVIHGSPTWFRMAYCAAAPNLSALTRRWPRASSARVCAPPRNPEFVIDSLISGSFLRRVVNVVPSSSAAAGRGFAALPAAPSPPDWSVNPFHPRRSPPRLRGRNALLQHHDLGPLLPHQGSPPVENLGWGRSGPRS